MIISRFSFLYLLSITLLASSADGVVALLALEHAVSGMKEAAAHPRQMDDGLAESWIGPSTCTSIISRFLQVVLRITGVFNICQIAHVFEESHGG